MDICQLVESQRAYFATGETLDVKFRKKMLLALRQAVTDREQALCCALQEDLGKSSFEGYMCEVGMVLSELRHMLRHLKGYARKKRVATPLAQFAARSYQKPTPYGNVLIMSPWNYPVLLTLGPLIDAIAAGNTAVVKPSAYSPATSALLAELLGELYPSRYVAVVTGGRQENGALLQQKFDMVFFTGSQDVGREVLRHTAETLTPAVLELGGKSPCIVDDTARLELAARRIVFGKFLNCGQTCVAPDYILCHSSVRDRLVEALCRQKRIQYGDDPLASPDYGKMISSKHYHRVMGLIDPQKVVVGGDGDPNTLRLAPTVMQNVTWQDAVMQQEIFGPVLPVLTYDSLQEVIDLLAQQPKPLALYMFSQSKQNIALVTDRCRFGGGCINDCVVHLATTAMGFGGVGESGMGAYHGKAGFDAFSHYKSILDKKTWLDLPMRYRPYTKLHRRLIRFFLK